MPNISPLGWFSLGLLTVLVLASIYSYRTQAAAIATATANQSIAQAQTTAANQNVWDVISNLLQTKLQNNTITTTTTSRPA